MSTELLAAPDDARLVTDQELRDAIHEIARFVLSTTDTARSDRLWPSDPLVYTTNPLSLAHGATGIALFLQDVHGSIPGEVERWMLAQPVSEHRYPPGLYLGLAGVAYGFAELGHLDRAAQILRMVRSSSLRFADPSMYIGVAGWGMANLQLHRRTSAPEYLGDALEAGEHLLRSAEHVEGGVCWKDWKNRIRLGFGYGQSGIALFLLHLFTLTAETKFLDCARSAMDFEAAHGQERGDALRWGGDPSDRGQSPYWLEGTSGVGTALIRFYARLGEQRYLDLAERAVSGSFSFIAASPHLFRGMGSIGDFMLDMFLFTGEEHYLLKAHDMAAKMLLFRLDRPEGTAFAGRFLSRLSNDYAYGSAGVGAYLLRLLERTPRRLHDMDA